jgi:hypothetical protein
MAVCSQRAGIHRRRPYCNEAMRINTVRRQSCSGQIVINRGAASLAHAGALHLFT